MTYLKNISRISREMNYRISPNLEYALMSLNFILAQLGVCVSAQEMTQIFNCPFHSFSCVLQKMLDHKIIISKQGIQKC